MTHETEIHSSWQSPESRLKMMMGRKKKNDSEETRLQQKKRLDRFALEMISDLHLYDLDPIEYQSSRTSSK